MNNLAIILAAGKGTRMKSDLPKCLHEVAGAAMVVHVMDKARAAGLNETVVVVGHQGERLEKTVRDFDEAAFIAKQEAQLGTAHAVLQTLDLIKQTDGVAVVLYGDTPLVREESLRALIAQAQKIQGPTVLGFDAASPRKYGRLITSGEELLAIREAKDASPEELEIRLCNSGVLACPAHILAHLLPQIGNDNASEEYYLTDVIEIAINAGQKAGFILCDELQTQGVNTPADLRVVNAAYQDLRREELLAMGAKMLAPETVFFHFDTVIGNDVSIEANVIFGAGVSVENKVTIKSFCHFEGAHIGEGATIGPFARLRPGAVLADGVHIGNFVEIKNSEIEQGAKVNHLSYIGDAQIGEASNIGAGTITCNYDGVFKHKTVIGKRAFIGTNSSLVAPLEIGDDAMTAAGSVITKNVPHGDLAIARASQENKPSLARKMMNRLRALKAKNS